MYIFKKQQGALGIDIGKEGMMHDVFVFVSVDAFNTEDIDGDALEARQLCANF